MHTLEKRKLRAIDTFNPLNSHKQSWPWPWVLLNDRCPRRAFSEKYEMSPSARHFAH